MVPLDERNIKGFVSNLPHEYIIKRTEAFLEK